MRFAVLAVVLAVAPARAAADRGEPAGTTATATIVDWPIAFDEERTRLTLAYRHTHQDAALDSIDIAPKLVVIHYTGGHSARATWRYFDRTRLEEGRKLLRGGGALNVSAHFLVARDGTIYRLMPETRMARHTIGLNHLAIGIENVGDGGAYPLTDAQLAANATLVRDLAGRFPITHLIGHHESRRMEAHPYWLERVAGYRNRKPDPGAGFMKRLRAELADLGLAGPPAQGRAAGGGAGRGAGSVSRPQSR